jgi:hypothetical protein
LCTFGQGDLSVPFVQGGSAYPLHNDVVTRKLTGETSSTAPILCSIIIVINEEVAVFALVTVPFTITLGGRVEFTLPEFRVIS